MQLLHLTRLKKGCIRRDKHSAYQMSKTCLIVGYGPGIGAACARRWSQGGYAVALVARTAEKVLAAAKDLPRSKGYACDVTYVCCM